MKLQIDKKRKGIIEASSPLLVTGGPGSGKTTIALLKAQHRIKTLKPGQEILFLSFSRAAVRQVLARCNEILSPIERKQITVRTYHLFCLEALAAHGRLLNGKRIKFLYPDEERLKKSTFEGDWNTECQRLATQEGIYCFDLVAPAIAALFERCRAVKELYAEKFPLVIVDEFQDTDDDQWHIVQLLLEATGVFCLADPDQRIFDYRKNVDPKRLDLLRKYNRVIEFDLGIENHRSPGRGILLTADTILNNKGPLPRVPEVKFHSYYNSAFESTVHAATLWTLSNLRLKGETDPTVAVLCRSNSLAAQISIFLSEEHQYKKTPLAPIEHDVVWDADLSSAAAQVLATILEWPVKERSIRLYDTCKAVAHFYRIKNAGSRSKIATQNAQRFDKAAGAIIDGRVPRIKAAKELDQIERVGLNFSGNPVDDWFQARNILKAINGLNEIFKEVRLVRLFRATDALASGLAESWLTNGNYMGASNLVKRILDQQRHLAADRDHRGCVVMTIHKAKGKEFDGVVLVEGSYSSQFFDTNHEQPPYDKSRRILRVAITRARKLVRVVRPQGAYPLVG